MPNKPLPPPKRRRPCGKGPRAARRESTRGKPAAKPPSTLKKVATTIGDAVRPTHRAGLGREPVDSAGRGRRRRACRGVALRSRPQEVKVRVSAAGDEQLAAAGREQLGALHCFAASLRNLVRRSWTRSRAPSGYLTSEVDRFTGSVGQTFSARVSFCLRTTSNPSRRQASARCS